MYGFLGGFTKSNQQEVIMFSGGKGPAAVKPVRTVQGASDITRQEQPRLPSFLEQEDLDIKKLVRWSYKDQGDEVLDSLWALGTSATTGQKEFNLFKVQDYKKKKKKKVFNSNQCHVLRYIEIPFDATGKLKGEDFTPRGTHKPHKPHKPNTYIIQGLFLSISFTETGVRLEESVCYYFNGRME